MYTSHIKDTLEISFHLLALFKRAAVCNNRAMECVCVGCEAFSTRNSPLRFKCSQKALDIIIKGGKNKSRECEERKLFSSLK
jgi:hypothetical protein